MITSCGKINMLCDIGTTITNNRLCAPSEDAMGRTEREVRRKERKKES
jgi:hypothetical protein